MTYAALSTKSTKVTEKMLKKYKNLCSLNKIIKVLFQIFEKYNHRFSCKNLQHGKITVINGYQSLFNQNLFKQDQILAKN